MNTLLELIRNTNMTQLAELGGSVINLMIAAACGIGIYIIFYITHNKISVSRSFAFTLIMLPPVSAMVSIIIGYNIVIAAGMLGALSIVRYRHSMKESKNLVFVFWAVTAGISAGLSFWVLTAIWCVFVAGITLAIHFLSGQKHYATVSIKTSGDISDIENIFNQGTIAYELKYRNTDETSDVLYELKYKKGSSKMVSTEVCNQIMQLDEVSAVKFVEM